MGGESYARGDYKENPIWENEAHYKYWLGAMPFYNNVEKEGVVIG